ncbi:hypothetical protein [Arthrobacter sp. MA-N2]|uniref:hypothetical protein n=1 Tax=Arthrobacter sp. MA-N2 TaxID=1101188 RepID=UPI0012DF1885|nr:hypothetical protein [Arthrobacter sp. MA-N2]
MGDCAWPQCRGAAPYSGDGQQPTLLIFLLALELRVSLSSTAVADGGKSAQPFDPSNPLYLLGQGGTSYDGHSYYNSGVRANVGTVHGLRPARLHGNDRQGGGEGLEALFWRLTTAASSSLGSPKVLLNIRLNPEENSSTNLIGIFEPS